MLESLVLEADRLLKGWIKKDSLLWRVFGKLKWSAYNIVRIRLAPLSFDLKSMLDMYSRYKNKKVFFVQIGACDGVQGDFIHSIVMRDQWPGLLVEPVGYLFDRLVSNYKECKNLVFENVAISKKNELKDFYYIKRSVSDQPGMYEGMGTFDKQLLLSQLPDDLTKYVVSEKIACITFDKLLEKNSITKIDLLIIDAEGHDYEIIKLIDFETVEPDILIYEWMHLDLRDYNECARLLAKRGYRLFRDKFDIVAVSSAIAI